MFPLLVLILAETIPALGVSPVPVAVVRKGSLQEAFDAANKAYDARQWSDAVTLFDALEVRLKGKIQPHVRAIVDLRRGLALTKLGRRDQAERMLRAALAIIAADDPILASERLDGQFALATLLLTRSDFAGAAQIIRSAQAVATTPEDKLKAALIGLRSTMFDPGPEALAYAAEAERLSANLPKQNKSVFADVDTLRARLLLNRGEKAAAYALLKKAVSRQGGLDMRINLAEVVTRSDLAIAALLNGDKESAREYLAYTGAGRIEKSPFSTASAMAPPACGGSADLKPEDTAIVEFGIDAVGAVLYAQTVYMSRPSPVGAKAFADAVLQWSWEPGKLAQIPAFYKVLTRIELRCSNAVARPSIAAAFNDARNTYLNAQLSAFPSFGFDAASLPVMRAELARREATPGDPVLPALMLAISMNAAFSPKDSQVMLMRAQGLLPPDAPVALRASVAYDLARAGSTNTGAYREALRALLTQPEFANDPVVAGIFRLSIAAAAYQKPSPPDAIDLVKTVADDARLDPDHPIKTAALLQLATLQSQARQVDAANATFARTGLTADQCALLDTPPAVLRTNADNTDFPMEAMRWGFDGWVRLEQDILADGHASQTRAVIAYPPFVFRDAAVQMGENIRYRPTFRPGSTKGCAANQQSINFRISR